VFPSRALVTLGVVPGLASVQGPGLGNCKNGEGDKDQSERNFHGWGWMVVAIPVGVKSVEVPPASLYAHRGRTRILV